jgi:5-methylcytosine-specific restriction endonuclease McrA
LKILSDSRLSSKAIAKLNDPDLTGKGYQTSNRLHENLRLACLLRDEFTCQYCKKVTTQAYKIKTNYLILK